MSEILEEESTIESSAQTRRWFFTINNPFFEDMEEVDLSSNTLPVREDWYDLSILEEEDNKDYFLFKYVKIKRKQNEFEDEEFVIKRPFFKDIDSAINYFSNLEHRKYVVFQLEQGKEETKHFQGGIIFNISKRFATIKRYFPTAYIDKARGSNLQLREYATKTETRIAGPFEIGEFSEQRSRTDIKEFLQLCSAGADKKELKELFPTLYLSYLNKLDSLRNDEKYEYFSRENRALEVTYIYGAEGVGKSTYVRNLEDPKNLFGVDTYDNSAFTNYNAQNCLLLDEFIGQWSIQKMNKLLDKFPYQLRGLGCIKWACYTKVYIISNLSLNKIYAKELAETPVLFRALERRIHKILRFDSFGKIHVEKDSNNSEQLELAEVPPSSVPEGFLNY